MEYIFFAVIIIGLIIGFGVVIFVMNQRLKEMGKTTEAALLKQDLIEISRGMGELKEHMNTAVSDRLDKNASLMRDTLTKQLSESAKLIGDVTQRLTKLDETNRRVVDVADELKTLQNVLQNPKQSFEVIQAILLQADGRRSVLSRLMQILHQENQKP